MTVARAGPSVVGVDVIIVVLVVLIVLALVGSVAVSPLLWVLVVLLALFTVLGRGRYYGGEVAARARAVAGSQHV